MNRINKVRILEEAVRRVLKDYEKGLLVENYYGHREANCIGHLRAALQGQVYHDHKSPSGSHEELIKVQISKCKS